MTRPIRVIVVDDSQYIRDMFRSILSQDPAIEVVATADDPYDAREKIKKLNPDVITLDVEMPKMDGIAFLEKIMALRPMPVVMVSTLTQKGASITLQALELGAVDCIGKGDNMAHAEHFSRELIAKVKSAAGARVQAHRRHAAATAVAESAQRLPFHGDNTRSIIAIGSSTGGVEALRDVLVKIPANAPPIVITQHMPPMFTKPFANRISAMCAITVVESEDGMPIQPGHAYIAYGGQHLKVQKRGGRYYCVHDDGEPVSSHKPSVDVLFQSVADAAGAQAVGCILTGMGKDGAQGLLTMRQAGAATLGESEVSCVVYGMPRAAFELGAVQAQYHLRDIAGEILKSCARL